MMAGRPRWFRRRWLIGTLVVALLVLAGGASQGLAGALGDGSATVTVYKHANPFANCPPKAQNKSVGTAQFELKNNTLTVRIKLRGADPGQYFVALWTAQNPCDWTGNLYGKFKVDGSGDGETAFTATVSGSHFFVDVYNNTTGTSNGSAVANL
jgi:hypothetical protein